MINEFFTVTPEKWEKYEDAYPGLDIGGEINRMVIWLEDHPTRRPKSERGYRTFVSGWLARSHSQLLAAQVRGEAAASYRDRVARKEARAGQLR